MAEKEKKHTKWERSSEEVNNRCPKCKCKLGYLHYYNYEDGTSGIRCKCRACGCLYSMDLDYEANNNKLKKLFIESLSKWRKDFAKERKNEI